MKSITPLESGISVLLAASMIAGLLGLVCFWQVDVSVSEFILLSLHWALVVLPLGGLLVDVSGLGRLLPAAPAILASACLGLFLETSIFRLTLITGVPFPSTLIILATAAWAAIAFKYRNRFPSATNMRAFLFQAPLKPLLLVVMLNVVLLNVLSVYQRNYCRIPIQAVRQGSAFNCHLDALWHAGWVNQFALRKTVEDPRMAGTTMHYHFAPYYHIASIHLTTGINLDRLFYRAFFLEQVTLLSLGLYCLGRVIDLSGPHSAVLPFLYFFSGELDIWPAEDIFGYSRFGRSWLSTLTVPMESYAVCAIVVIAVHIVRQNSLTFGSGMIFILANTFVAQCKPPGPSIVAAAIAGAALATLMGRSYCGYDREIIRRCRILIALALLAVTGYMVMPLLERLLAVLHLSTHDFDSAGSVYSAVRLTTSTSVLAEHFIIPPHFAKRIETLVAFEPMFSGAIQAAVWLVGFWGLKTIAIIAFVPRFFRGLSVEQRILVFAMPAAIAAYLLLKLEARNELFFLYTSLPIVLVVSQRMVVELWYSGLWSRLLLVLFLLPLSASLADWHFDYCPSRTAEKDGTNMPHSISSDCVDALLWIREQTPVDALFVSNELRGDNFQITGIGGRRELVNGWMYSPFRNDISTSAEVNESRLSTVASALESGSDPAIRTLIDQFSVTHVFWNKWESQVPSSLNSRLQLVFENHQIAIYRIAESKSESR